MMKIKRPYPLVIIALIFLFNPNANIIDILPDCVAYLLLIAVIGKHADTVPYLAECKGALTKLALVTAIKIPAFFAMYSNMFTGRDIVPLFTLMFVALELVLLYYAVENGYKALSYIGERTDCASVRDAFLVGKKSKSTPEGLRIMTFVSLASQGALNIIPEMLLLTPESFSLRKKLTDAYPTVLIFCILASLIIGAIWLKHAIGYARAIKNGKDILPAIDSMSVKLSADEISAKDRMKKLTSSLTFFGISGVFIFDITLSTFGGYNILPHFIYGIMLFCAFYNLTSNKLARALCLVSAAGFSLSSMLGYLFTIRFFDTYTYMHLSYSKMAKEVYSSVKIFAVIEILFTLFMLSSIAFAMLSFIKEHTDVAPTDPAYSITNRKNHLSTFKKTLPLFVISAIISVLKCANVFIKQTTKIYYSEVNPEGITASSVPAMDTIIFLLCIIYVIYSFVTASNLKDEVKFKYDKY